MKTENIVIIVVEMLDEAGFPPDLYIIKSFGDSVTVHFDDRAAIDYFVDDVEKYSEHAQHFVIQKGRDGKRHTVTFQLW